MNKRKIVSININLAPKDPFFGTVFGRTLKWALSVGRYIVIFTELIVIVSFASRFTLDRQVTDLNEKINQRVLAISQYESTESEFRLLQKRLEDYKQVESQNNLAEMFPKLTKVIPQDVTLDSLTINLSSVVLRGTVQKKESLNNLISNLQLTQDFVNVIIDKIESNSEKQGFTFSVKAETKSANAIKVNNEELQPGAKPAANDL